MFEIQMENVRQKKLKEINHPWNSGRVRKKVSGQIRHLARKGLISPVYSFTCMTPFTYRSPKEKNKQMQ